MDLIESQPRRDTLGKVAQTKLPTPPPALPFQPADLKRKREPKGKEVVGARQTLPPHEDEAQKVAKHAKVGKKGAKKRSDPQVGPLAWLLAPMSNGEPLLANTSIRKFQGRVAGYVTDAVDQALLLLEDMAELRDMRRHKIFLSLKGYLAMVRPLPFFLICFLYLFFFFLIFVSFLGKLFKPPSRQRR